MEGQQLPKGFEMLREPDWVQSFVRKMMTKSMPEIAGRMTGNSTAKTTETKLHLGVKLKLPSGYDRDSIRLYVREDRIRVEGLPNGMHETVKLPKLVNPRICQAVVKDGMLQIKLRKRPLSRKVFESHIYWHRD